MRESKYRAELVKRLEKMFPGCFILDNDPKHRQGVPDIVILYWDTWASLEIKNSRTAPIRPNQEYYVEQLDNMSFSSFIFPENEEEVLSELQRAFGSAREARLSKSK